MATNYATLVINKQTSKQTNISLMVHTVYVLYVFLFPKSAFWEGMGPPAMLVIAMLSVSAFCR